MYYRKQGIKALEIIFNNKNNIKLIENEIHNICNDQDEYKLIIQQYRKYLFH